MKKQHMMVLAGLMLLSASCGRQHQARTLVDDFMEEHMVNPKAVVDVSYAKLDSTRVIGDSVIAAMRQAAKRNPYYKPDITYSESKPTRLLYITRVDYCIDNDTCQDTYYINEDLTGIVAFKSNLR
jgi:hypothetical protein